MLAAAIAVVAIARLVAMRSCVVPGAGTPTPRDDRPAGPASETDVLPHDPPRATAGGSDLAGAGRRGSAAGDGARVGDDAPDLVPVRAMLRRIVLDGEGRPIVGARIGRVPDAREPLFAALADPHGAVSDASGRFELSRLADGWPEAISISVPGRPTLLVRLDAGARIRLPRTITVRGRVVERDGDRPLPGVPVEVFVDGAERIASMRSGRVRTDADGAFVGTAWGRGTGRVIAFGAHEQESAELDFDGAVLRLRAAGESGVLAGHVRYDGQPLAGVRVALPARWPREESVTSPPTGADGAYEVGPVWSRREDLLIDGTEIGIGTCLVPVAIAVADGRAPRDVTLPPRWSVAGRVTRGGAPVEGVAVSSSPWRRWVEPGTGPALTGASGAFRLVGHFARRPLIALRATAPTGESVSVDVRIPAENGDVSGVEIELGRTGHVRGRVRAADGRPIAGANVHARTDAVTDERGWFDVVADAGRTRVMVRCPGYVPRPSAWLAVPEGERGAECDVALAQGGAVTGRVVDTAGAAIQGAVVRVEGAAGIGGSAVVRTWGADGRFAAGQVVGETFRVRVEAARYVSRVLDAVAADSDVEIALAREERQPR